ncbi:hypothetical protein [Achromobacter sp. DH1f]|uniref:hypothetical protein n=1 Tax=Achromobacter sp. DH1f TaxID=1397275 RepID=UPI000468AB84|nr:hypothetical protein [Achromobacter sp. DH1f]
MINQNNAAQTVLTDDEINAACCRHAADTGWHAENDRKKARAVESALLSKLRAEGAPVHQIFHSFGAWEDVDASTLARREQDGRKVRTLYAVFVASAPVPGGDVMQDQRKEFETWAADHYAQFGQKPNLAPTARQPHNYADMNVNSLWWGWQAGQAAMLARGGGGNR